MGRLPTVADGLAAPDNNFGWLRLALAVAVVVSHAGSVLTGSIADEPGYAATGFTMGEHAVNGFFAISGFLVTMSFERRGWRDYLLARILRIAPGFVVATLVVSLGLGTAMSSLSWSEYLSDGRLWRFIQATLAGFKTAHALPGVFAQNALPFPLGTVWTLKYETICYAGVFVAGLFGLLAHRRLALALWLALIAATILREVIAPDGPKSVETALRLPLIFMTGALAWLWREKVPLPLLAVPLVLAALLIAMPTPAYKAALYVGTAWLVLVLALAPALAGRFGEPRSDLSYGIYLYGWPIQQALAALWPQAGAGTMLGPALALSVLVALASWHGVEKPALALKRRLLGKD